MSVRVSASVWEHSRHSGSRLLMLLAIADFADDDGNACPTVAALAKRCGITARYANVLLVALQSSGELDVQPNAGPHGANVYRVRLVCPACAARALLDRLTARRAAAAEGGL